jgi:hypothetical protein
MKENVHHNGLSDVLRAMSGPAQPNVLTDAADALERMRWRVFDEEKPDNYSRVLVHLVIGKHSYVDAQNYIAEPDASLPTLCSFKHVRHWMPLPEPPA